MTEECGWKDAFGGTCKKDWWESFIWLVYVLLGSLSPIYLSIIVLLIAKQSFSVVDFAKHGEFSIYSAGILAISCYIVLRDKRKPFPQRSIFGFIIIFGFLTSTAIFASVTAFLKIGIDALTFDEYLVTKMSLFLFVFSLLIAYLANVLDSAISRFDPRQIVETQEKDLKEKFDELEDNG